MPWAPLAEKRWGEDCRMLIQFTCDETQTRFACRDAYPKTTL